MVGDKFPPGLNLRVVFDTNLTLSQDISAISKPCHSGKNRDLRHASVISTQNALRHVWY